MAGIANTEKGTAVAGSRGYFLTGPGVLLNQALISYAVHFLTKRGATMLQTPFTMNKSLMAKAAAPARTGRKGGCHTITYTIPDANDYLTATAQLP